MDYQAKLSTVGNRMLMTRLRQDLIALNGNSHTWSEAIPFISGLPDNAIIPIEKFREIANEVIDAHGANAFQYAPVADLEEFKTALRNETELRSVVRATDDLVISNGSQSGLFLTLRLLINSTDTIITEAPTYTAGLTMLESLSESVLGVHLDENGLIVEDLERLLKRSDINPKIVYVIPTFHNPTGITMSLDRRKHLLELASTKDLIIVEDDVYSGLRFSGKRIPTIKELDTEGRTIYIGSFSKVLSPALRIGFVVADPFITSTLIMSKIDTEQSGNTFSQYLALQFIKHGFLKEQLSAASSIYSHKLEIFLNKVKELAPPQVSCTSPLGGMFLWLSINSDKIDTMQMLPKAIKRGVAYLPSSVCFPSSCRRVRNGMRINFVAPSVDDIALGVNRLCATIEEELMNS